MSFSFQLCTCTSACADKVAALEMFKEMQKEEGLESRAKAGMYSSHLSYFDLPDGSLRSHFDPITRYVYTFKISKFLSLAELAGEEELSDFLKEDREDEPQRFWSSQAETQKLVRDVLQVDLGQWRWSHLNELRS